MSQATRPNDRHIIWSNQNLDVDDWREDYKEFLEANELDDDPNDEQALYEWMEETNYDYLSDERVNLNVQLSQPIIVIGDIGRWNGRVMGYKDIPSGNIRDCLYADTDYTESCPLMMSVYDNMEISGGRAVWKDVLAVYAVKTNTDKDNPQEVATMDESKKQILSDIFWEMNSISSRSESHSETEITETDDGNGNIVQTETTVTKTTLYITVSHLTVDEMADLYGFDAEQREYLAELLKDENNSLWAAVLYGIRYSEDQIVTVALSQVGNVGGEPYWSWYGFGSRVEWCACFVSWCADQCGYIDTGVVPKYAGCVNGVQWFKERGQWIDGSAEPVPGMIVFFDWDNKGSSGPQDGQSDHTGIVQKVENGIVYTVEGNSGDSCRVNQYSVGHYEILGYGVPQY